MLTTTTTVTQFEYYNNPHVLNCSNKDVVSRNVAHVLFGKMVGDQCQRPGSCPLCGERVTAHHADQRQQVRVANTAIQFFYFY